MHGDDYEEPSGLVEEKRSELVDALLEAIRQAGVSTGRREAEFGPPIQRGRRVTLVREDVLDFKTEVLNYKECPGIHTFFVKADYFDADLTRLPLVGLLIAEATFGVGGIVDTIEFDVRRGEIITLPAENCIITARFADGSANSYDRAIVRSFGVPGFSGIRGDLTRTFERVTCPGPGNIFVAVPAYARAFSLLPREAADYDGMSHFFFNTGNAADVAQSLGEFTGAVPNGGFGIASLTTPTPIPGGTHFIRIQNSGNQPRIYTPFFHLSP